MYLFMASFLLFVIALYIFVLVHILLIFLLKKHYEYISFDIAHCELVPKLNL